MFMRGAPCGMALMACSTLACGGNSTLGGGAAGGGSGGALGVGAGAAAAGVGGGMSAAVGSLGAGGVSAGGDDEVPPPQARKKSAMGRRCSAFMAPRLPGPSPVDQDQGLPETTDSHLVAFAASFGWL